MATLLLLPLRCRSEVAAAAPHQPVTDFESMPRRLAGAGRFYGLAGQMFIFLGGIALVLAALGLYGVMSSAVARKAPEFGVRMALGATPRDILILALKSGLGPLVLGALFGLALGAGMSQLLSAFLYRVEGLAPTAGASSLAVLMLVGLAACMMAARRASPTGACRGASQGLMKGAKHTRSPTQQD